MLIVLFSLRLFDVAYLIPYHQIFTVRPLPLSISECYIHSMKKLFVSSLLVLVLAAIATPAFAARHHHRHHHHHRAA